MTLMSSFIALMNAQYIEQLLWKRAKKLPVQIIVGERAPQLRQVEWSGFREQGCNQRTPAVHSESLYAT